MPLARLDGVDEAVAQVRTACEELRWHSALRRRWAVARAEAGVRSAHAGSIVDGHRVPLSVLRDVARGAEPAPEGPGGEALLGAQRVQAAVERLMRDPGATAGAARPPFAQLLATLHVAAAVGSTRGDGVDPHVDHRGRPRSDEQPRDVRGLGPAPIGPELSSRLAALAALVDGPLPAAVSGVLVVAVVHGELLALRPFDHANGAVARAVARHQLTASGVDPVGVVVVEKLWSQEPSVYLSAAAGFATGTPEGVGAWVRYVARSVVRGAEEGREIADAVVAGRLAG
jgi:hypothetical protein